MKKHHYNLLVGAVTFFCAPLLAFGDGGIEKFILDKNYLDSIPPQTGWLYVEHSEIHFVSGATAYNCDQYLKERRGSLPVDSKMDLLIECEYVHCVALELLQKAKPHNGYKPASHTRELFARLDLQSFYNTVLSDVDTATKHTLADTKDPEIQLIGDTQIFIPYKDLAITRFFMVADADINGNGEPDWIFVGVEKALDVLFQTCSAFVIYDVKPTGLLKAVGYPFEPPK